MEGGSRWPWSSPSPRATTWATCGRTRARQAPSRAPAATTSTPPRPGNRQAGGGGREHRRWASWRPGRRTRALRRGLPADRPADRGQAGQVARQLPAKFADHLARLKAAEPHATAERLIELEREAAQATRQPAAYTDVTVSFSKSISVLHASIRENARRARLAGDERAAAYWAGQEEKFQEILHRANRAALEYMQAWAGVTRSGYHGIRVDGQEPGRFEEAGLIVTSWLQGTSRDGDPQDHIHNQIARITRTVSDGKWRAHDTASLRAVLGALQAVAATAVECELTREFGVAWVPRADGRGNEIQGVTQAQMDAYSTRTVQVHEKERELAQAWERQERARAELARAVLHRQQGDPAVTQGEARGADRLGRAGRAVGRHARRRAGGHRARSVERARPRRGARRPPAGSVSRAGRRRGRRRRGHWRRRLWLVAQKHSAWTRHDLLKQLALVMPPETRQMDAAGRAGAAARSGGGGAVRADGGCRVAGGAGVAAASRRAAPRAGRAQRVHAAGHRAVRDAAQLSMEDQLVAQAQTQGAPRLPRELAARRLGADVALLEAQLRDRAHDARDQATRRGLRLDQAAAIWHVLTSDRTVEVITGPAGTGKTRVLAAAARAWDGPVFGTATSQNATNELRNAGVRVAANTTRLIAGIGTGRIPPGSLIVVDEGSMVSMAHLSALVDYAARQRVQAGTGRGPGAAGRRGGRRRDDAARRAARVCAAGRAGPVHRRMGARGLAAAAPRGRDRAG